MTIKATIEPYLFTLNLMEMGFSVCGVRLIRHFIAGIQTLPGHFRMFKPWCNIRSGMEMQKVWINIFIHDKFKKDLTRVKFLNGDLYLPCEITDMLYGHVAVIRPYFLFSFSSHLWISSFILIPL